MSEILLPLSAKSYYIVNNNYRYNSNYDIIWSFKYSISGYNSISSQLGYTTFLTPLTSTTVTGISAGHYLCTKVSEPSNTVTILSSNQLININPFNIITIAFDTTGMFALSSATRSGLTSPISNTMIIRDITNSIVCVLPLSSTSFSIATSSSQTIRCIYSNGAKTVEVAYKSINDTTYSVLTTVNLPYRIINNNNSDTVCAGISYCSPISSLSGTPCNMLIENMHIEGVRGNTTVETLSFIPLA